MSRRKVIMNFYLISSLERVFQRPITQQQIKDISYIDDLQPLIINNTFEESDVELEKYENLYMESRKVVGCISLEELLDWEYIKYSYFYDICQTMGSITGFGWLSSVSYSTEQQQDYHTGIYSSVNMYISPFPLCDDGFDNLDTEQQEEISNWIDKWIEYLLEGIDVDQLENIPNEVLNM